MTEINVKSLFLFSWLTLTTKKSFSKFNINLNLCLTVSLINNTLKLSPITSHTNSTKMSLLAVCNLNTTIYPKYLISPRHLDPFLLYFTNRFCMGFLNKSNTFFKMFNLCISLLTQVFFVYKNTLTFTNIFLIITINNLVGSHF